MPRKKKPSHFLETETGFRKLLKAERSRTPSARMLQLIHDHAIRTGDVDPAMLAAGLPGSAGFYLIYIMKAEKKSGKETAAELGIETSDLELLQSDLTPVQDKKLLDYCSEFVKSHASYSVRPLFTLLKRAIVLYSMSASETPIRKAARKKKSP